MEFRQWKAGETIETGYAYLGVPEWIYHDHPAMNQSRLKLILKNPSEFLANKHGDTEDQVFGQGLHTLTLEPAKFQEMYAVCPSGYTGKDAAKWKEQARARNPFVKVIEAADHAAIHRMVEMFKKSKTCIEFLDGNALKEVSLFWIEEFTCPICEGSGCAVCAGGVVKIECKCRIDLLRRINQWYLQIVDIKSTIDDVEDYKFWWTAIKWGYDFQLAFYTRGLLKIFPITFRSIGAEDGQIVQIQENYQFNPILIPIKKTIPNKLAIYQYGEEEMADAQVKVDKALRKYVECCSVNVWPEFEDSIQTLKNPTRR